MITFVDVTDKNRPRNKQYEVRKNGKSVGAIHGQLTGDGALWVLSGTNGSEKVYLPARSLKACKQAADWAFMKS